MELYFAGAETPTYLRKMRKLGVKHIAISYLEWQHRFADDTVTHHIPDDMHVVITAGVARKGEGFEWLTFSKDYLEFCEKNAHFVDYVYDLDAAHCPMKIRREVRDMISLLPNGVVFPVSGEDIMVLAKEHDKVGINANTAKSAPTAELRRIHADLFGSNVTDLQTLRNARFTATTTMLWLNSRRYGEIWVFARGRMRHYTADVLRKAVKAHKRDIEALGVDPALCSENNPDALMALAIRSFQALVNSITDRPRDRRGGEIAANSPETLEDEVFSGMTETPARLVVGNGVVPLAERIQEMLPGITMVQSEVLEDTHLVRRTGESYRQCDSCSLSDLCPGYVAEASCKFMIPIEIRTAEQVEAASAVILEMQFGRVALASFSEQLNGEISPRTGQEMDRFQKLLLQVKELKTPIQQSGGGVIARALEKLAQGGMGTSAPEEENDDEDPGAGFFEDEEDDYEDAEVVAT